MNKDNRNNEQIYGRNDMIMLDQSNKIYGSLGIADNYVMKTEEGTMLVLNNPKQGRFGDVLTEFNMYGKSKQKQYKGINLFPPNTKLREYAEVSIPKGSNVFWVTDGTPAKGGNFRFFNEDKTESMWFEIDSGTTSMRQTLTIDAKYVQNLIDTDFDLSKICLGVGNDVIYEPYTGGIPSPSPDYPQEIKSVGDGGSVELKVTGANVLEGTKLGVKSTMSGITYTTYENGILITGTATSDVYIKLHNDKMHPLTHGIYYITARGISPSISVDFFYTAALHNDIQNMEVILNKDVEYSINLKILKGATLNTTVQVSLTRNKITSYEPYEEEQTAAFPYILNAIPVSTGGNYTDADGQQWIADYIDFKRGKLVKMVNSLTLDGDKLKFVADSTNTYWNLPQQSATKPIGNDILSNYFRIRIFFSNEYYNFIYTIQNVMAELFETVDELNAFVFKKYRENDPVVLYYGMQEPIETDLTLEQIEQYKKLSIRTPTTIVENNYNTWMKATYKSIESV